MPEPLAESAQRMSLETTFGLFGSEHWAVAVLDDGSEIRMRNLGDRVEVRSWDKTASCKPPALGAEQVNKHIVDLRIRSDKENPDA